jgi:hypothetical protein
MLRFALLFTVGLVGQVTPRGLPPIERHHVGPVAIGADAQTIYVAFPADRRKLVDLACEGMLSPALLVRFVGARQRDGVVAELVAGRERLAVWRIEIRDPGFKTLKGIGVGSTVGQLRAAYHVDSVRSGEGNVVIRVEQLSAGFVLNQSGQGDDQLRKLGTPATVPDSVKIKSVLLTK